MTGDVTGRITGDTVGNVNSSGVSTFTTLDVNGDVDFDGHTHIDNMSVSGVSTFTGNVNVSSNFDVDGFAILDKVNINDNVIQTNTSEELVIKGKGTGGVAHLKLDDDILVSGISTFQGVIEKHQQV